MPSLILLALVAMPSVVQGASATSLAAAGEAGRHSESHATERGPWLGALTLLGRAGERMHAGSSPDTVLDRVIAQLSPGQRVRLSTSHGWVVSGSFVRSDSVTVIVRQEIERSVDKSVITELWTRTSGRREAATTGALIGGLAGGALGLAAGSYCAPQCAAHEGLKDALGPAMVGLFGGAAIGAVIGTLIGSSPRWVLEFP